MLTSHFQQRVKNSHAASMVIRHIVIRMNLASTLTFMLLTTSCPFLAPHLSGRFSAGKDISVPFEGTANMICTFFSLLFQNLLKVRLESPTFGNLNYYVRSGVRLAPARQIFCAFSFLIDFCRACRQFASHSRKLLRIFKIAVQIKIFHKRLFLPYHHLLWATHTTHALTSVPGRVFGSRRVLPNTKF